MIGINAIPNTPVEFIRISFIGISITYGSLLFLGYRKFLAGSSTWTEESFSEIDDHYHICCLAGLESKQVLEKYRRTGIPNFAGCDTISTRLHIETNLFWLFIGILFLAGGLILSSIPVESWINTTGFMIAFTSWIWILMVISEGLIGRIRRFQYWRKFWIQYWEFARDLSAPANRLMDQQFDWTLDGDTDWGVVDENKYSEYVREVHKKTRKMARKRHLQGREDWPKIEDLAGFADRMIWFENMKEELDYIEISDDEQKWFPIEILDELKSLDRLEEPKEYPRLFRWYRILGALETYRQWPEPIEQLTLALNSANQNQRREIFRFASERLREFRDLPHLPVPGSMKWIALLYALVIAASQYVASIIYSILLAFNG